MKAKRQMPVWVVFGFATVFLSLSAWQFYRLSWKEDLVQERQEKLAAEPLTWPFPNSPAPDLAFHRAVLSGHFEHAKEMYLIAGSVEGKSGYHVVVPFRLLAGPVILVNRGWVPPERKNPATRPPASEHEFLTISGILRTGMQQGLFVPDNIPTQNLWTWVDLPAMIHHAQIDNYISVQVYLDIDRDLAVNNGPIGGQTPLTFVNNHLEYALTWLLLAVLILVFYYLHPRLRQPK